jgi:hypothetical protein
MLPIPPHDQDNFRNQEKQWSNPSQDVAVAGRAQPFVLSGGLGPRRLRRRDIPIVAIDAVHPFAIDRQTTADNTGGLLGSNGVVGPMTAPRDVETPS